MNAKLTAFIARSWAYALCVFLGAGAVWLIAQGSYSGQIRKLKADLADERAAYTTLSNANIDAYNTIKRQSDELSASAVTIGRLKQQVGDSASAERKAQSGLSAIAKGLGATGSDLEGSIQNIELIERLIKSL